MLSISAPSAEQPGDEQDRRRPAGSASPGPWPDRPTPAAIPAAIERRPGEHGDGRRRAHRQGPRAAEQRVHDHRHHARVEPDLHRQVGDGRVRHRLRDHHRAGGEPTDEVLRRATGGRSAGSTRATARTRRRRSASPSRLGQRASTAARTVGYTASVPSSPPASREQVPHLPDVVGDGRAGRPRRASVVGELVEHADAVMSTNGDPPRRRARPPACPAAAACPRIAARTASALAKKSPPSTRSTATPGVRRVLRVAVDVAELVGRPRHPAELGDVRPRRAVEQEQQRHGDADEQPGQRVEHQHAEHGGDRRDEVGPGRVPVDLPEAARCTGGRSRAARGCRRARSRRRSRRRRASPRAGPRTGR